MLLRKLFSGFTASVLTIFGVYADQTAKISPSVELEEEIMGTGPGTTNDTQPSKSKSVYSF